MKSAGWRASCRLTTWISANRAMVTWSLWETFCARCRQASQLPPEERLPGRVPSFDAATVIEPPVSAMEKDVKLFADQRRGMPRMARRPAFRKETRAMKWSWKIGQLDGIDLRIHSTFLVLLGWIWASYYISGNSLVGTAFIAALFASVALHEFGHVIVGRGLGIRTRDITLLPIGGVTRLERMPAEPRHELWVALAGPAVSVALAGILYGWPVRSR